MAVGAFHIQYRYGLWSDVSGRMMVANDEIDTNAIGILHFFYGFDAAVQCNDKRASFFFCGINSFGGNTVSFGISIGNIIDQIIGLRTKKGIHKCYGGSAIHIVVSINHDSFMFVYGAA